MPRRLQGALKTSLEWVPLPYSLTAKQSEPLSREERVKLVIKPKEAAQLPQALRTLLTCGRTRHLSLLRKRIRRKYQVYLCHLELKLLSLRSLKMRRLLPSIHQHPPVSRLQPPATSPLVGNQQLVGIIQLSAVVGSIARVEGIGNAVEVTKTCKTESTGIEALDENVRGMVSGTRATNCADSARAEYPIIFQETRACFITWT